jgi:hypothetical protein
VREIVVLLDRSIYQSIIKGEEMQYYNPRIEHLAYHISTSGPSPDM